MLKTEHESRPGRAACREGRVGEVWLIDADCRQFEAHGLRGENYVTRTLGTGRWESIALAGFSLAVDWLWCDPAPPLAECKTG